MIKMKSERPLLINGVAQTEFETTNHHARELEAKGLAVPVGEETPESDAADTKPVEAKAVVSADVNAADTAENKTTAKRK